MVLSGEQSNTSIVFDCVDAAGAPKPLICKVFRMLHDGENPDVTVQGALSEGGSRRVPAMVGAVSARWPSPVEGEAPATGHLAFAQEFFPGTEDAWAGRELTVGAIRLRVVEQIERCRMVGVAQVGLPARPGMLKTVSDVHHLCAGVYADVVRTGTVAVGDPVRLG